MANTTLLFANNAETTLSAPITDSATTVVLASGTGALFPSPNNGAGEYFDLTFNDAATGLLYEVVKVTARVGDTLTIVRGQEGTTALAWNSGDYATNMWTRDSAYAMLQSIDVQNNWLVYCVGGGTANAITGTPATVLNKPAIAALYDGMEIFVKTTTTNTTTTPTFKLGALAAKTIVKNYNTALIAGDCAGTLHLVYNSTLDKWVLMNPSKVSGALYTVRVFTSSTTYTPSTGINSIIIEMIGGGGAGGGAPATAAGQATAGAGGAAGGYLKTRLTSGFSSVVMTIGTGGAAGATGSAAGGNGGTTSFGAIASCTGGNGGYASQVTSGSLCVPTTPGSSAGGVATSGNIFNCDGNRGDVGMYFTPTFIRSGNGGTSVMGSGGDGFGTGISGSAGANGAAGTGYGSGGAGGGNNQSQASGRVGGAGMQGVIVVYEYY